ncbi:MAG: replication initiation protein [Spiroplasma ixodetis]|nr:replication initiation protein [Spiroplasma ixodetis]MBP1527887.1 replication initiation protein [Spiroplasma ixodetis]
MEFVVKNQYDDLTVYYANELARMCSKFTLEEEKVLHLIFSQIKPYEKNDTTIKINKLDFFNKLELESKDRYPRYRKLVHGLINKTYLELKEKNGKELIGVVITASRWNSKESFFEINLNNWFMPFLEQLVKNYTKLQLNSILKLKSKYALTLYKYICSWNDESKNINQRYITTKDLKELLGLSIDDYVYNGKFQRKLFENYTIKKAILEINEKTNLILSFRKNKKGNKIQNYEFTWMQKENALTTKTSKKQVSLFDLEKENQKQQNIISNEFKQMLNNIDKDNEIVFDN